MYMILSKQFEAIHVKLVIGYTVRFIQKWQKTIFTEKHVTI
jgi:hypothetical protein